MSELIKDATKPGITLRSMGPGLHLHLLAQTATMRDTMDPSRRKLRQMFITRAYALFLTLLLRAAPAMHHNEIAGLPREKINMVMNLTSSVSVSSTTPPSRTPLTRLVAQAQAIYGPRLLRMGSDGHYSASKFDVLQYTENKYFVAQVICYPMAQDNTGATFYGQWKFIARAKSEGGAVNALEALYTKLREEVPGMATSKIIGRSCISLLITLAGLSHGDSLQFNRSRHKYEVLPT